MKSIAIVGKAHSGKTTFAGFCGFNVVRFAEPLYAVNRALGIPKNRELMQEFSDLVKKHFGGDFFLNSFRDALPYMLSVNLVCDDVRYETELRFLKEQGWYLVFIDCEDCIRHERAKALGMTFNDDHSSESGVSELRGMCDLYINNGHLSLEDFKKIAEEVARSVSI